MVGTANQMSGSSGAPIGYMLGDKLEKDQQVRVVGYNGFMLSRLMIAEIERIPATAKEREEHKKAVWKIANGLSKVFDARAAMADYRVNNPLESYIVSCVDEERERLRRIPTAKERKGYGMPKLKKGKKDDRPLEKIILDEFLERIGVHGDIEKRLRRKKDGKKYTVTETVHREAMFLIAAHDGTVHPHWHILTARPDEYGFVNDTRDERYRILAVVRKLSKKYKLSLKLENYEVDLEKTNEGYATKIRILDAVKAARDASADREELKKNLAEKGVVANWLKHKDNGEEYGVTFTMKDKKGKEHTWSGSQLDRSLSLMKIDAALAQNLASRQAEEASARDVVAKPGTKFQKKTKQRTESKPSALAQKTRVSRRPKSDFFDAHGGNNDEMWERLEHGFSSKTPRLADAPAAKVVSTAPAPQQAERPESRLADAPAAAKVVSTAPAPQQAERPESRPADAPTAAKASAQTESTPSNEAKTLETQPKPHMDTSEVIHVTVQNAKSVSLPAGFRALSFSDNMAFLLTPVGDKQIPDDGLFLVQGIRGDYQCLTMREFEAQKERRARIREKYKQMKGKSSGQGRGIKKQHN